jgi:hypothetical protein
METDNPFVLPNVTSEQKVFRMKKISFAVALVLLIVIPTTSAVALPPRAPAQHKAIVISSLNALVPLGYYGKLMISNLNHAGYNVTYLADSAVTIDFLVNHLNDYDIVLWRTNTFNYVHTTYWYVGERVNDPTSQKYTYEFAQGWINGHAGILGVSLDFFNKHFPSGSLNHLKLLLFISSTGSALAPQFVTAGVSSVIYCNGFISLQFGLIDDLTNALISYLTAGQSVLTSVYNTVSPFNQGEQPKDPLDSTYSPPFWFVGNGALTIT